jgi:exonuclease SbcC
LGLDRLDALEIGLEPIRDLRNARRIAKSYDDVDRETKRLDAEQKQARTELGGVEGALKISQSELELALKTLALQMPPGDTARSLLRRDLASSSEEPELINSADRRRQLAALRRAATRFSQISKIDPGALELALRSAQEELEAWRSQYDRDIKTALASVVEYSPNATLGTIDDPGKAVQTAIAFLAEDLDRFENVVRRLEASNKRMIEIEDTIKHYQSRIAALNEQIAAIAVEAGPLSLLLSEVFLHIRGE